MRFSEGYKLSDRFSEKINCYQEIPNSPNSLEALPLALNFVFKVFLQLLTQVKQKI